MLAITHVNSHLSCVAAELAQVQEKLNYEQVDRVFTAIDLAEFVWFTGVGKSGRVAQRAAESFQSVGRACAYIHATELLHGGLGAIRSDDTVIAVSHSGKTEETVQVAYHTNANVRIAVAPTASPLAVVCTHTLDPCVPSDADGVVPSVSLAVQGAVLDGLVSLYQFMHGVTSADVALNHPEGTLGERT